MPEVVEPLRMRPETSGEAGSLSSGGKRRAWDVELSNTAEAHDNIKMTITEIMNLRHSSSEIIAETLRFCSLGNQGGQNLRNSTDARGGKPGRGGRKRVDPAANAASPYRGV